MDGEDPSTTIAKCNVDGVRHCNMTPEAAEDVLNHATTNSARQLRYGLNW